MKQADYKYQHQIEGKEYIIGNCNKLHIFEIANIERMAFKTRYYSVPCFLCLHLLLFLICYTQCTAASAILTINVKNEGARGDGKTNDHEIFVKISNRVNARGGNCKIVIPAGTYIIGKQAFFGNEVKGSYKGEDCFFFQQVRNVEILSIGKVKFKYAQNLKFGSFSPITKQKATVKQPFFDRKHVATIGCFLRISECSGISISNVDADGNNTQIDYGGYWGDVGRQCLHVGIFVQNSDNIKVAAVRMHHFGLDGLELLSTNTTPGNITITNSQFDYNLRNGCSWIGGKGVIMRNCKFNMNGLGANASNPRAGLDIEPEVAECENGL